MGAFFVYILKSAVCLVFFYLFYRLLLSKETFHRFNRFALLGILLLSLIVPLIKVSLYQPTEISQTVLTVEQLLMMANVYASPAGAAEGVNTPMWIRAVLLLYSGGIAFFICRNIYSLICVCRLLRSGSRIKLEETGIVLITHDKGDLAPFSWMKFIVISRKDLEENGEEIVAHETAHIKYRHSIDLLLAEICIFFQWFNPAAWLIRQELQNIHEYEADETVINKGIDAKRYQLLLIKKAVGTRLYSMANSFNHSKLKKRITMMLKEKSSPWARLKILYVLPVAAIAVTAFARPQISDELEEIAAVKVNDLTAIAPTIKAENDSLIRQKEDNAPTQEVILPDGSSLKGKVKFIAVNSKAKTEPEIKSLNYDNDSKALVIKMKKDGIGTTGKEGEVTYIAQKINLNLDKDQDKVKQVKPINIKFGNGKSPLIIVDGKELSNPEQLELDPETIALIEVLKDGSSTEQYGKKGENGVMIITLKDKDSATGTNRENKEKITVKGQVTDKSGKPVVGAIISIIGSTKGTISDIDGNFSIDMPEKTEFTVSYIDMKTKVVKAGKGKIKVKMEAE